MASRKVSRMRGRRTHGYGSPKKHRGKGSRGGRGMAGSGKHRKTYLLKYEPDHGGESGFKSKTGRKIRAVNLRDLLKMAGSSKKIDAAAMGYDKVLGTGEVKAKLEVKASFFSASAKRKIEEAGGKAIGFVSGEAEEEAKEEAAEGSQEEEGAQ
ncbi:MAG: uL15 family ribosomal protein [Candidatus Aenigmarchaeota archaeon]|nr:uL15 family ribosomal protein [Candidatus Aenigmarchaeota archaeon]